MKKNLKMLSQQNKKRYCLNKLSTPVKYVMKASTLVKKDPLSSVVDIQFAQNVSSRCIRATNWFVLSIKRCTLTLLSRISPKTSVWLRLSKQNKIVSKQNRNHQIFILLILAWSTVMYPLTNLTNARVSINLIGWKNLLSKPVSWFRLLLNQIIFNFILRLKIASKNV